MRSCSDCAQVGNAANPPKMATNAILGNFVCIGNIRNHSNFPTPVAVARVSITAPLQ